MLSAPKRRPAAAFLALTLSLIPASALPLPSSSSRTCCFTAQTQAGCIHRLVTTNPRHWSIAMIDDANEDEINNTEDDENDEDSHEPSDINVALRRISWLPSVLLGKQAYRSPSMMKSTATTSRRRDCCADDGENKYESIDVGEKDDHVTTQSIEILPVLPMTMVRGLEKMMMSINRANEYGQNINKGCVDENDQNINNGDGDDENYSRHGDRVWEGGMDESVLTTGLLRHAGLFSVTSSYLPHTRGHILTVAEPRYKKLYDDLLRLGRYHAMKKNGSIRRSGGGGGGDWDGDGKPMPSTTEYGDDKQRFIVTMRHPTEDGVFAEYGLLFQVKDFDEVAAVGENMSMKELEEIVGIDFDDDDDDDEEDDDSEDDEEDDDVMDMLLRTHYEATHDVVGRVKIHRFVNPQCYSDGPEGEEYLMAESTVLDLVENDRARSKMLLKIRGIQSKDTTLSELKDVAKAVARVQDELRSSSSEVRGIKMEKVDSALDEARSMSNKILRVGKGVYERRNDGSLMTEERLLREAFASLVTLQHELKEDCRFTRVSVQSFGIGPVGVWLSAAAWSNFVDRRFEAAYDKMQSELQTKLVNYLADRDSGGSSSYVNKKHEMGEAIDFDDLSPDLQSEFQLVQARAIEDLGPLALDLAIQMQCIVQADGYPDRLTLLRECVDNERRRLEAKKMLHSLNVNIDRKQNELFNYSAFERLVKGNYLSKDKQDSDSFQ